MTNHLPTPDECQVIRDCAQRSAGRRAVRIEPGSRVSLETGDFALNVALISNDPDWENTDLHDFISWKFFRRDGFEFTADGRAIIDFYVYSVGKDGELETNVTAYWDDGVLVRVDGTDNKNPIWSKQ